jgi:hypothetical protein
VDHFRDRADRIETFSHYSAVIAKPK